MTLKRPMLAGTITDSSKLRYPVIASAKLDGIRCLKVDGKVVSRSFKPIQNEHIRAILEFELPEGADGEIMSGETFQDCTSAVMRRAGKPEFTFWMFDLFDIRNLKEPYTERIHQMEQWERKQNSVHVAVVPTRLILSEMELLSYEEECLADGFEGVMVRDPDGPYKEGRSTEKQGWLLKLKRFVDAEAQVIGFEELFHNLNAVEINELGLTTRSHAKEGKVPADTLGKFKVRDLETGAEFFIGTGEGLTQSLRKTIWRNRRAYLGKVVKYKYQAVGVKEVPRLPVWLGFRDRRDRGDG